MYQSQIARDSERVGYRDKTYWDALERAALADRDFFLAQGNPQMAQECMTRLVCVGVKHITHIEDTE